MGGRSVTVRRGRDAVDVVPYGYDFFEGAALRRCNCAGCGFPPGRNDSGFVCDLSFCMLRNFLTPQRDGDGPVLVGAVDCYTRAGKPPQRCRGRVPV
jgi:hypothetical protein